MVKVIAHGNNTYTRTYNSLSAAERDVEDWYINCSDDDFAENVLYDLLCDIRENNYEVDSDYNIIFER